MSGAAEVSWLAENWARVLVAISSTGTLGIAARFYSVWRRGRSDDAKLESDGDAAIRAHYAIELESLRQQIIKSGDAHATRAREAEERYRLGLQAADERHHAAMIAADEREAACHAQVRGLREQVAKLSDEIFGLRNQLGQTARSAIVLATHAPSQKITEAAERAASIMGELDHGLNALPHLERNNDET